MQALKSLAIVGAASTLVLAGCSSSDDTKAGGKPESPPKSEATPTSAAPATSESTPAAAAGFPCTGYPAMGNATPADTPLPTAVTGGNSSYTTGSVEGPTSYFGGPYDSAGVLALTQQWTGAQTPPLPPQGQENSATPCDNTQPGTDCTLTKDVSPQALNYCSYYAAMRFTPTKGGTVEFDVSAYDKVVPPTGDFHKWANNPMNDEASSNLSWLYGRQLKVTRNDNNKSVIVRAADRGPGSEAGHPEYDKRPIDLSPWAVGALADDPSCIAFDGAKGTPAGDAFMTKCDWTNDPAGTPNVTIEWVPDNNLPLGPVK